MKNFAIKREQNQACLSYAEREQNRRVASMKSEESLGGLRPWNEIKNYELKFLWDNSKYNFKYNFKRSDQKMSEESLGGLRPWNEIKNYELKFLWDNSKYNFKNNFKRSDQKKSEEYNID